ncbi:MAG: type II toxin-antitoxin system HicB family antitoxin [Planctomycetota bacterium]
MGDTLHLTAVIWPESGGYVSQCPELGVASFGATPTDARTALKEAVELWVENAKELGLLEEVRAVFATDERYATPLDVAV